jgi:hypothetical protein
VACSLAFGLSAAACDQTTTDTGARGEAPMTGQAAREGTPLTVTGCLQHAGGLESEFILTEDINVGEPVGTSGSGTDVRNEQLGAARRSYRLSGAEQDLDTLVGKQIRVTGTLTDAATLPRADAGRSDREQMGRSAGDNDRREIDADDLAQMDVQQIETISERCAG